MKTETEIMDAIEGLIAASRAPNQGKMPEADYKSFTAIAVRSLSWVLELTVSGSRVFDKAFDEAAELARELWQRGTEL